MAGSKEVLVKRYPRWKGGKREVRSALRLASYPLGLRKSKDQLVFKFYQTGRAREDAGGGADLPINNATCTAGLVLVAAIASSATV
jgi:hypothetical protein